VAAAAPSLHIENLLKARYGSYEETDIKKDSTSSLYQKIHQRKMEQTELSEGNENDEEGTITLKFLTAAPFGTWIDNSIQNFMKSKGEGVIDVELIGLSFPDLFAEIKNEATFGGGLYDGFVTPPSISGSIHEFNGWADLTPTIKSSDTIDWPDMFLAYRKMIAQYEEKIIMMPLDGDMLVMYYNQEILDSFDLKPPRTWDEYLDAAKAVHSKVIQRDGKDVELVGSCIGRTKFCAGSYWATNVLSTMTQSAGFDEGHLFDTADMLPLTGEAMEEMLRLMEGQVEYGAGESEFGGCIGLNERMMGAEANCALTIHWGDLFKKHLAPPMTIGTNLGIAPTPGSKKVLDRKTMKLVDCDEDRCPNAIRYDDIGLVNQAPYAAFGGWSCAVSNYTSSRRKAIATEFCAFASGKEESTRHVIPNATNSAIMTGQDPFRQSHIDLGMYDSMGYNPSTTKEFLGVVQKGLSSENAVIDNKFPTADQINEVLDVAVFDHLQKIQKGEIPDSERESEREKITLQMTQEFKNIISKYDEQDSTAVPALEAYQRNRGVYKIDVDPNLLGGLRWFGWSFGIILIVVAISFAVWTTVARKDRIVRGSQPLFLVLICVGVIFMATSLFPLGIDDGVASQEQCNHACMATIWLFCIGFTCTFAALFSKIHRLNKILKAASKFKRVKVSEKDVLPPLLFLLSVNIILLLILTLVDPLTWVRKTRDNDERNTYGSCLVGGGVSIAMLSLLGVVNVSALILANIESYRTRNIKTEYNESKYVEIAMIWIAQVAFIGIPLLFLVQDNPSAKLFVTSCIIIIVSLSVLVLIFIPKIIFWKSGGLKKGNTNNSMNFASHPNTSHTKSSVINGNSASIGLKFDIMKSTNSSHAAELAELKRKITELANVTEEKGSISSKDFQAGGLSEYLQKKEHANKKISFLDEYGQDVI